MCNITFTGLSLLIYNFLFQLICYKTRYFQGKTNYLECAMHVSVFIFVAKTDSNAAVKTSFQWQACSVGLFLAWFNLVLYLKRFASYGIYVVMMRRIFVTCIKVCSIYMLHVNNDNRWGAFQPRTHTHTPDIICFNPVIPDLPTTAKTGLFIFFSI